VLGFNQAIILGTVCDVKGFRTAYRLYRYLDMSLRCLQRYRKPDGGSYTKHVKVPITFRESVMKLAEKAKVQEGDKLYVEGQLIAHRWENPEKGYVDVKLVVLVESFEVIEKGKRNEQSRPDPR